MRKLFGALVLMLAVGCGNNVVSSTTSSSSSGGSSGSGSTGGDSGSTGSGSTGGSGSSGSGGSTGESQPRPTYPAPVGTGYGVGINKTIANLSMTGYLTTRTGVPLDTSSGVQTFDLQKIRNLIGSNGQPYSYLLLDVSAGWCGPCNDEGDAYAIGGNDGSDPGAWEAAGGLFVTVLAQNYSETHPALPTADDLGQWIGDRNIQTSLAGDVNGDVNATITNQSAFPGNFIIRLDDMTIRDAWYGEQFDKSTEFTGYLNGTNH